METCDGSQCLQCYRPAITLLSILICPSTCHYSDFMAESLTFPDTQDTLIACWNKGGLCVFSLRFAVEIRVFGGGVIWSNTELCHTCNPHLIGVTYSQCDFQGKTKCSQVCWDLKKWWIMCLFVFCLSWPEGYTITQTLKEKLSFHRYWVSFFNRVKDLGYLSSST